MLKLYDKVFSCLGSGVEGDLAASKREVEIPTCVIVQTPSIPLKKLYLIHNPLSSPL